MKVLIIDDSVVFRILLSTLVKSVDGLEVCGTAKDGAKGVEAVEKFHPDVVLLDVEMPNLNGLEVMMELKKRKISTNVIICSAFTVAGAEVTVKALELGAHDFITKPEGSDKDESMKLLREQLIPELEVLKARYLERKEQDKGEKKSKTVVPRFTPQGKVKANIIGIGISTGGPKALAVLLPSLPENFPCPIVIVQHMPKLFLESMAVSLNEKCSLKVKVAVEGERVSRGTVYLAPGEVQMAVKLENGCEVIRLFDDPPENFCKPAADYLFRSLIETYGSKSVGIVMTGMGCDGAKGLLEMKKCGSHTISQDKATSTIYGMPREAVESGAVEVVLSLDEMAGYLVSTITGKSV